jgi:PAS domain S-box-containing protein
LLGYGLALAASGVAMTIVAAMQPLVGFVPLLYLAAVALVQTFAGWRPAVLTVIACTLGSLIFMGDRPVLNERVHDYSELLVFPAVAAATIYLVESRRRHRRVVREQWLEISTLLESMPEAVFIFDRTGRLVDVNRVAEQVCARSRGELIGKRYADLAVLLTIREQDQPVEIPRLAVARALRGETVQNEERVFRHPQDNTPFNVVVSANPMRSDDGRIVGALVLVRDVTELRQLQGRVADTERHLAVGQMASGISHDFNNLLNTITQATAVLRLRHDTSEDDRRLYLGMIDNAARRGAEIIKRLREYIRGGTGEIRVVDVPEILNEALELTQPMWRGHAGLKIERALYPVAPVRANAPDLRRVFTNLIINAIQAMPEGGNLRVACHERDGHVEVDIADTGQGIPPEQQKKIFLPYFTTKTTGTGLGLSTAQKIVLAQGGNLRFTSEVGRGSVFTVELPATVMHANAA